MEVRSKPSRAIALGKYVSLGTRENITHLVVIHAACEALLPACRVHTHHRVALHAEKDMSTRPAPPAAAAGAADAGAADDRSSRNPDGAIQYRGGRFDCRMCAHEPFGVKKKVTHSGIRRCRLELARVARVIQIAEHAAAPAAAVAAAGESSVVAAAGSGLG